MIQICRQHPHDTRDTIVDYLKYWTDRAETPMKQLLFWLELGSSKYHTWRKRYGKANEHNGQIPRDWWLESWEKQAIIDFHDRHPLEGYRRLTFMMLDADVVAVSPSSTYRVLKRQETGDKKRGQVQFIVSLACRETSMLIPSQVSWPFLSPSPGCRRVCPEHSFYGAI